MEAHFGLILGIMSNAVASILIKITTQPARPAFEKGSLSDAFLSVSFWLGVIFYGLLPVFYTVTLSKLPLHVVQPIMTVGALSAVAILLPTILADPATGYTIAEIPIIIALIVLSLGLGRLPSTN